MWKDNHKQKDNSVNYLLTRGEMPFANTASPDFYSLTTLQVPLLSWFETRPIGHSSYTRSNCPIAQQKDKHLYMNLKSDHLDLTTADESHHLPSR